MQPDVDGAPDAIIMDLGNTLVDSRPRRTFADLKEEHDRLSRLRELLKEVSEYYYDLRGEHFKFVIITGSSFDYTVARIEMYRLWELRGVEVIIASENGLYAQSFRRGVLWRFELLDEYKEGVKRVCEAAEKYKGLFYLQGNTIRTTFRAIDPVYFDEVFVPFIVEVGKELGFLLYEGGDLSPSRVGTMYWHKGDALDIDPFKGVVDGEEVEFPGKAYPIRRLSREIKHAMVVGDGLNDIPMFDAAHSLGYACFTVKNHSLGDKLPPYVTRIDEFQAEAINVLLERVLAKLKNRV